MHANSADRDSARHSFPSPSYVSPEALGRGLAVLRIFFGIIFFANGVAKLTGVRNIEFGWYGGFLIVRNEARNILEFEVNRRNETGTRVPFLKDIVNDIVLPSWDIFQWVVTWTEIGVGALLILGLVTRGAGRVAVPALSRLRLYVQQPVDVRAAA